MTAAEGQSDFKTNFLETENETSGCLLSEKNPDIRTTNSIGVSSNMNDKLNSIDPEDTDFPAPSLQEIAEDQDHPDIISEKENSPKSSDDGWLDIMGSGDFKKKVIKPGLGLDTRPNRGDRTIVDITYYIQGNLFEEKKDLKFIVGDLDVIQGVDLVVCLMEKGERAKVMVPSKLAYGTIGLLPDVPPDSDIECDIELKEVEPLDEDALTVSERLKLGDEKRSRGNFFYDRAQYIDAIHCYERSADYLDGVRDVNDSSPEELQAIVNMRIKVYNNMAASHLKLSAHGAALKSVESVLKIQPKNVKALFRKGKILGMQGSTDDAIACMKTAAGLEPDTKVIQVELTKLYNRKRREEQTQKEMYKRMFKCETKTKSSSVSMFKKWSVISCGILAVAIASAFAYKQMHT